MPELKENKNLKNWQKLIETLNTEVVNKGDFVDYFEKVIKIVLEIKKQQTETIDGIKDTFELLKNKIKGDYDFNLSDLSKKLDKQLLELKNEIGNKLSQIKDGEPGKDADEVKIVQEVLSKIKIPKIEEIENDLPKLGTKVRDSLELLQGDEKLEKSAIKGLDETLKEMDSKIVKSKGGGGKKITYIQSEDLSSQVNGVNKSFTLPRKTLKVVAVMGSQWPTILRNNVDWTFSGNILTLTNELTAPEKTQTLIALIEVGFYGG